MSAGPRVAVVGATGAVGRIMLEVLASRGFAASARGHQRGRTGRAERTGYVVGAARPASVHRRGRATDRARPPKPPEAARGANSSTVPHAWQEVQRPSHFSDSAEHSVQR